VPLYIVPAALILVLSVPLLVLSLVGGRSSDTRVRGNLREGFAAHTDLRRLVLSQSATERIFQPVLAATARRARRVSPGGVVDKLEKRIVLAGMTTPVELILVIKLALVGVLGTAGVVVFLRSPSPRTLLFAAAAGFIGYLAPDVVLARRAGQRQLSISNELPDLLDQVTICVEAGLGFDAALARSTRAAATPLSAEVARMHQELRIGVPRREALDNMLARTDVPGLRQFAHALIQAEAYGTPVTQMLRAQALEHREKRRQAAEEMAMKLPVKITFPLVFCILPALFVVILAPAAIKLLSSGF